MSVAEAADVQVVDVPEVERVVEQVVSAAAEQVVNEAVNEAVEVAVEQVVNAVAAEENVVDPEVEVAVEQVVAAGCETSTMRRLSFPMASSTSPAPRENSSCFQRRRKWSYYRPTQSATKPDLVERQRSVMAKSSFEVVANCTASQTSPKQENPLSGLSTLNFRVEELVKSFGLLRESSKVLTTSTTALTLILSFDKPLVC